MAEAQAACERLMDVGGAARERAKSLAREVRIRCSKRGSMGQKQGIRGEGSGRMHRDDIGNNRAVSAISAFPAIAGKAPQCLLLFPCHPLTPPLTARRCVHYWPPPTPPPPKWVSWACRGHPAAHSHPPCSTYWEGRRRWGALWQALCWMHGRRGVISMQEGAVPVAALPP